MKTKTTPQELLNTLTIPKYTDDEVVATMPTEKSTARIELFNVGKCITDTELMKEYESRGLEPALPADVIEAYKDSQPHDWIATVWNFKDDVLSYLAFNRWDDGERSVSVDRSSGYWGDDWWFAGVRKLSTQKLEPTTSSDPLNLALAIEIVKKAGYKIYKEI